MLQPHGLKKYYNVHSCFTQDPYEAELLEKCTDFGLRFFRNGVRSFCIHPLQAAFRCWVTSLLMVFKARFRKNRASSPLLSLFQASSKNYHERIAEPHPLSVIGWNTIYFGFEWLVVPYVFGYNLGEQADYRDVFFFKACYGA